MPRMRSTTWRAPLKWTPEAGAAHSGDDVLSLPVQQSHDGVLVVGKSGGAAPLAEDVHGAVLEKMLDLGDDVVGQEARWVDASRLGVVESDASSPEDYPVGVFAKP